MKARVSGLSAAYAGVFALALVVTVATGLGWAASRHSEAVDHSGPPLTVLPALQTQEVFFGDEVSARVEVVADTTRVRLGSLRIRASFEPYSVGTRHSTDESLGGGYVRRVTTYSLRCLRSACLPRAGGRREFRFPDVRVGIAGAPLQVVPWPRLLVISRLHGSPGLRVASLRAPAAISRGRDWSKLLLQGSGGLGLAGLALIGYWVAVRRRRPEEPVGPVDFFASAPDPVSDACARVRSLFADASRTRRKGALDALAATLAADGEEALAHDAQALAWRGDQPSDTEVDALLERVEGRAGDRGAETAAVA